MIKFVGGGPGSPLDNVLKVMSDLQQQLEKLNNPTPGVPAAPGGAANAMAQLVRSEAARAPDPVRRWLNAMVGGGPAGSANAGGGGAGGPAAAGAIPKQLNAAAKKAAVRGV